MAAAAEAAAPKRGVEGEADIVVVVFVVSVVAVVVAAVVVVVVGADLAPVFAPPEEEQ